MGTSYTGCDLAAYNKPCEQVDYDKRLKDLFLRKDSHPRLKLLIKGDLKKASSELNISIPSIKIFRYLFKLKRINSGEISISPAGLRGTDYIFKSQNHDFNFEIKIADLW